LFIAESLIWKRL